jgi:tetrathionate reductase subunit B
VKAFVVDASRCVGCYSCQVACKDEHVANDWMPYAKPQPDAGQFWMRVDQTEHGSTPQMRVTFVPVFCQHCDDAPCIAACAPGAITKRPDGLVLIDPKKCTGCRKCMNASACPYGVIYFNDSLNLAQKCTGCAHLLDNLGWKEPRCVDACPTNALKFGEESALAADIAKSENLHPEFKLKPRVHYLSLSKPYIAGCVYDPAKKEIIEGATCTLTGGSATATLKTDGWGDFWFEGLTAGVYSVKIEAGGKTKTIDKITVKTGVGLGDIALA